MAWQYWLIVIIPLLAVFGMALYSRRYIRSVSDFLVAGRVAGRYVISVAGMESALGVLTLVALVEVNYATGFAITFWQSLLLPLGMGIPCFKTVPMGLWRNVSSRAVTALSRVDRE